MNPIFMLAQLLCGDNTSISFPVDLSGIPDLSPKGGKLIWCSFHPGSGLRVQSRQLCVNGGYEDLFFLFKCHSTDHLDGNPPKLFGYHTLPPALYSMSYDLFGLHYWGACNLHPDATPWQQAGVLLVAETPAPVG